MAGKKYKPALYELVGKGRVKPDDKGALNTPRWFYGEGESEVQTEPMRQEPKVIIHQGPRIPQPTVQEEVKKTELARPIEVEPKKEFGLQLGKEVRIRAPWWAVVLASLGLVLGFLVMYRIGQMTAGSAQQDTADIGLAGGSSPADAAPSEELKTIRDGEVQTSALDLPKPKPRPKPAVPQPVTQPAPTVQEEISPAPAPTAGTGSLCLILCGSEKRQNLISVQEYFSTKGILTRIGRLNDRYVLYTDQGADSRTSGKARQLQSQIAKLGAGYNQAKPRTAAVFLASTFENAYWVNRSAIVKID